MRCERCSGSGTVYRRPEGMPDEPGWLSVVPVPCPDCIGGTAHCCDGLTAANDKPADPEDTE